MSGRVITTVSQIEQDSRIDQQRGATRERRRIRRLQAKALKLIRSPNSGMTRDYYADIIAAATKAPKKGKRK